MLDPTICPACGDRAAAPEVVDDAVRCGGCGHRYRPRRLPLFVLTGPSGAGKSSVAAALVSTVGDAVVVLEQDVLWTAGLRDDRDGHPMFRAAWLRLAAMLHQNGRPVLLCGTVVPPELEPLAERALFAEIHYLALTADDAVLATRLRARPAWRGWQDEERITEMLEFADWLRSAQLTPAVQLLDTTDVPLPTTVDAVSDWVRARLP